MFRKPFTLLLRQFIAEQGSELPKYKMQIQKDTEDKLEFSATLTFENHIIISTSKDENLAIENAARSLYCSLIKNTNPLSPAVIYPIQFKEVVQELATLCFHRCLPYPKFTIVHVHSKIGDPLTYLAYCNVGNIQSTALGEFAELARVRAALKIYHSIQCTKGPIVNENIEETFNKIKISDEKPLKKKSVTFEKLPKIINSTKSEYENLNTQLKTKKNSNTPQSSKSIKTFKSFKKCIKCGFRPQNPYHKL